MSDFSENVIRIIRSIPRGKVMSYGMIAAAAGNHKAARQVSWILRRSGNSKGLPWHRVVNGKGKISLPDHDGGLDQRILLEGEGVVFHLNGSIDRTCFWNGQT